jgi:hypothetical protein
MAIGAWGTALFLVTAGLLAAISLVEIMTRFVTVKSKVLDIVRWVRLGLVVAVIILSLLYLYRLIRLTSNPFVFGALLGIVAIILAALLVVETATFTSITSDTIADIRAALIVALCVSLIFVLYYVLTNFKVSATKEVSFDPTLF